MIIKPPALNRQPPNELSRLIANELSLEMVLDFVGKERRARVSGAATAAAAAGLPPQFGFAARFPPALWADVEAYFGPDGDQC